MVAVVDPIFGFGGVLTLSKSDGFNVRLCGNLESRIDCRMEWEKQAGGRI